jgi:hypothetical protein
MKEGLLDNPPSFIETNIRTAHGGSETVLSRSAHARALLDGREIAMHMLDDDGPLADC